MVGSLVEFSLRSISNGIKDGTIKHIHLLPPNLRQRLLTWLLDHNMVNDPKCLSLVTSVEFLTGMTSISTEGDSCCDLKFLRSLQRSISTVLPVGGTVGASITKLKLQLFCCSCSYSWDALSLPPVISRLIGQCPNITSLAFCSPLTNSCPRHSGPWQPTLLTQDYAAYNRVMENLVELSIFGSKRVLCRSRPIINFRQLTTLRLENCSVIRVMDKWPELLRNVPTLENLHVINVYGIDWWFNTGGLDSILPFSMPELKSLELLGFYVYNKLDFNECNKAFVDNLIGCPKLRQVYLMLDKNSTDEESLVRLASMDIDLKVKIRFNLFKKGDTAAIYNSYSHIKLVRIFHQRMVGLILSTSGEYDPKFSTVLEDVVDKCMNLSLLHIHLYNGPASSSIVEENRRIKASLIKFFGNLGRALKLKSLSLAGNLDEAVISAIFENCLNLVRLSIRQCPQLRDHHLIDWVARGGGRLTHLSITYCANVSSEGIISVLAQSGERLLHFDTSTGTRQISNGRTWNTPLYNLCPQATIGSSG